MMKVVEFYLANQAWIDKLIWLIIVVISTIVVCCSKKKNVLNELDNILKEVLQRLPEWINQAEVFDGAEVKKQFVLRCAITFVKEQFSVILPASLIQVIGNAIEDILSTPQKKNKESL